MWEVHIIAYLKRVFIVSHCRGWKFHSSSSGTAFLPEIRWRLCICNTLFAICRHGPLTRYVKLRVAHAPRMPGTLSPPRLQRKPLVSDPGMHHGTCVTHVPWCMLGSLTRGGGENGSGIPGACATRNFTYLARGPWTNNTRIYNLTEAH